MDFYWFYIVKAGKLIQKIKKIKAENTFPNQDDYVFAAQSLLRLHEIYYLNIDDMIKGILMGKKTTAGI